MISLKNKKTIYIVSITGILFSLFHIYTSLFGNLDPQRQRAVHLLFAAIMVFIIYPNKKNDSKNVISILDIILIAFIAIPLIYIIVNNQVILMRMFYVTPLKWYEYILSGMLIVALLEGSRRVVGLGLPIIAIIALLYAFLGRYIPGNFGHSGFKYVEIFDQLVFTTEGIFGVPLGASATFVILFIIFGAFLEKSGIATYFMELSSALTMKSNGGPAKLAVVSSGLFGSVSGSAIANVVTTGQISIPMMKKIGYRSDFAGAVEAVASTGGQIMPPVMGAAVFIMSDFTGIPYIEIVKHAILPALLYFISVFYMVHFEALKFNLGAITGSKQSLKYLLINSYLLLPLVIIVVILMKGYSPTFACLTSMVLVLIVAFIKKETRMGVKEIADALIEGAKGTLSVAMACGTAGIIVGIVNYTGLGFKFTSLLLSLADTSILLVLLMTALATMILGMGLPTTPAYVVVASLMVPTLVRLEVPLVAAHLFAFYFANIANITPPVALASYTAAGIADSDPMKTGLEAFRLGIAAYIVPFIFVFSPSLLLIDVEALELIWTVISAIIGVIFLASAAEGWLKTRLSILERILLIIASVTLMYPGLYTDVLGFTFGTIVVVYQFIKYRTKEQGGEVLDSKNG
jgi:TRAP transporter 4TM/12TM fusion protein